MAMPKYEIRDIPDPLWTQLTNRANEDGYPLHVLMLQLLQDYADGHVRPRGQPPLQQYAFLKEPFRRVLIKTKGEILGLPVRERWAQLRAEVELQPASLALVDAVPATNRAAILAWLERLHVKQANG